MMQSSDDPTTSGQEFKAGWRVLLAAALGVTCGITAVPIYTIGTFVGPLEDSFAWSRGSIQAAIVFAYTTLIFAGPVAGWVTDKYGARRVALWSVFGISLGVASAAVLADTLWGLYLAYGLIGILGAGTSPVVWTRGVNSWFIRKRGLALGITLMGTGIFATLSPIYVTWAIAEFGWRGGYLALALVPLVVVFPAVYFFFYERKDVPVQPGTRTSEDPSSQQGVDLSTAARTGTFWILGLSFLLFSTSISGYIASYIPMLTDAEFSREAAATMAGFIGISVIMGRLIIGYLLDHFPAHFLSAAVMSLPAIGCFLWAVGATDSLGAIVAAVFIGLAGGAEFDLVAYMTAKFFGMRHYGKIYGVLFSFVIAGAAIGPMIFGFGFDLAGTYTPILFIATALFLIGGISQLFLNREPLQNAAH